MGNEETAKKKIIWIETNMKKFKDEDVFLLNFVKKFDSTERKFKELLKMLR